MEVDQSGFIIQQYPNLIATKSSIGTGIYERSFCISKDGLFVNAPRSAEKGNEVWIVKGGNSH
jgi:hypothetical protein